ncbi:helix-turn-helix domain-containing protein [Streptomyces sp. PR69]|uniref:helix-turn-helix domain-containing protein n=1 Tax=Streptomyces sp. PR69 TaxID=2984950 RepID=UPI002263D968|nr:XRE family transcriptional regulator [Streptomyces sp. PR69]
MTGGTDAAGTARRLLARELTELRCRTGLSLPALADRTSASSSAWHRWLSGAQLPPHELVRELCRLADEPPGRLLALIDLAREADDAAKEANGTDGANGTSGAGEADGAGDTDDAGTGPSQQRPPLPPPLRTRFRRPLTAPLAAVLLAATAAATATAVIAGRGLLRGEDADSAAASAATSASASASASAEKLRPGCHGEACTGRLSLPLACGITGSGTRTVVEHRPERGPSMEIRYSPTCDASWARMWFGEVGDRLEISLPGQSTQRVEIKDSFDAEGYVVTPMIGGGPEGLAACLIPAGDGERRCLRP